MEIWKAINESPFENKYEVSNLGNIRKHKNTLVKQFKNFGYMYCNLSYNGVNKKFRVHRLVAKAFLLNDDPSKTVVGHKDNDKSNNNVSNLEWTTVRENTKKAYDEGLGANKKGLENLLSEKIKVLDKATLNVVGVYGSISECERCVKNVTRSYISKQYKVKNYKPRTKKYIYSLCSDEDFYLHIHLHKKELIENESVDKSPSVFFVKNTDTNEVTEWDNQSVLSKIIGIPQAKISLLIRTNGTFGKYKFTKVKKIKHKDSTYYENLLLTIDKVSFKNIYTNEIKTFKTKQEAKSFFRLVGNSISNNVNGEWERIPI